MPGFKHALCIYPYAAQERTKYWPPTGLEYVASAFATSVPRVTLADMRHDTEFTPERRLHDFIRREGVDLIGISLNWWFGFDEAVEMMNRLPRDVFTVVGGPEATDHPDTVFERCPGVDAVVRGDGEEIAVEIASGRELAGIDGLSWRHNGEVVHNGTRVDAAISSLPPRDRSLRRTKYSASYYGVPMFGRGIDSVSTSRGCPYNCTFCPLSRNPLGRKRRYEERSAEDVFEEIRSLDADLIAFVDDNPFVSQDRMERLCDLLIANGVRKRFGAHARIELARNPRLLAKLVRAGFKTLLIGIEAANDRSLKVFKKGFTTAQVRESFKVFRRFPMVYHGYFIIGNVGETEEEMMAIPPFAREIGLDSIGHLPLHAMEFTPMRDLVEKTPGYHLGPHGFVYSDRYSMEDIWRIRQQIKRDFYTVGQAAKGLRKAIRARVFTTWELVGLPVRLPHVLWRRWRGARP